MIRTGFLDCCGEMDSKSAPFKVLMIKLLLHGMALLPLRAAHSIGAVIGRLMWRFDRRGRQTALRNLALCFPELELPAQRKLAKQSMNETGKNMAELGAIWLWPVDKTLGLITQVSGNEWLEQAFAEKRGVILLSPHLGCWELIGLYRPMLCLYRPPRMQQLDSMLRKARTRNDTRLAATDVKGVRSILQELKRGGMTGILPDQDPGPGNGQFAPFFGQQANTMTLVSKLASKSKARVGFAYAERLEKGQGYHLHFIPASEEIYGDNSLSYMNQQLEQLIRCLPSQYLWSYKRFKTRPEGERDLYHQD